MFSRPDGTWYASKRDAWVVLVIWASSLGCLYAGYAQMESGVPATVRALMLVFFLAAAAFCLWVLYDTGYAITSRTLYVQSGPFRFSVPLDQIHSVTPTRSPLSSPACSLDRLDVRWGPKYRSVLISPAEKTGFLRQLDGRCPELTLDGDRLRGE